MHHLVWWLYDAPLTWRRAFGEIALVQNRKQSYTAWKALLEKIRDGDVYNTSWWGAGKNIHWLKESGFRGSGVESDWRYQQRVFRDDGERLNE